MQALLPYDTMIFHDSLRLSYHQYTSAGSHAYAKLGRSEGADGEDRAL